MSEIERLHALLREEYSSPGTLSRTWWKEQWYTNKLRRELRCAYDHDLTRYLKAYDRRDDEVMHVQESGMQYFAAMVHRYHRRSQLRDLSLKGQQLLDSFCSKDAGIVFLALDFEGGNDGVQSIRECGIASFSDGEEAITTIEFATRLHTRKIRFGETVLCDPSLLKDRLIDTILAVQRRYQARDILLVGHGIIFDMRILEALRVDIFDLPIAGIVDTWALAQQVLGVHGSLGDLLSVLSIPMRKEALHCAANDAHFTMQLLLALLSTRYEERSGRWSDIITRPLPSPKYEREEQEDWSEDIEGVLDSLSICD